MQILTGQEAQNFLEEVNQRSPKAVELPENWRDETFDLKRGEDYGLDASVIMRGGRSVFGNKVMEVIAHPSEASEMMKFGVFGQAFKEASVENFKESPNSIQIGDVKVVEHHAALRAVLGIHCNWQLTQSSFPILPGSSAQVLETLKPALRPLSPAAQKITVKQPTVFNFGKGRHYALDRPVAGKEDIITVDHQIQRPQIKDLGKQRLQVDLTPEVFAYMAKARTLGYGFRTTLARIVTLNGHHPSGRLPYLGIGLDNAAFYAKSGCINPNPAFIGPNGINFEAICHEAALDKTAPLAFLPGRYVGGINSALTNHHKEVNVIAAIMDKPDKYLEKI